MNNGDVDGNTENEDAKDVKEKGEEKSDDESAAIRYKTCKLQLSCL